MKWTSLLLLLFTQLIFAAKIKIGVEQTPHMPFYDFSKTPYKGYFVEFMKEFSKQSGLEFEYTPLSINRLVKAAFVSRTVDLKFPDNPVWGKEFREGKNIVYSRPVNLFVEGLMINNGAGIKSIDQIKNIAIPMGFTPVSILKYVNAGKITAKGNSNMNGLLLQVASKRTDGAYVNKHWAIHTAKEMKLEKDISFRDDLPTVKSEIYMSTIGHGEVIEKLNKFLLDNKTWVDDLAKKYGVQR